jgi:hypothetical protein
VQVGLKVATYGTLPALALQLLSTIDVSLLEALAVIAASMCYSAVIAAVGWYLHLSQNCTAFSHQRHIFLVSMKQSHDKNSHAVGFAFWMAVFTSTYYGMQALESQEERSRKGSAGRS